MAKSLKEVQKNVGKLKRAMGLRGELKAGDLTIEARKIMSPSPKKSPAKLPPVGTKQGLGVRGLI